MLDPCGFLPIAETAIQCHKDDKVTSKIADEKSPIEIGRPSTLDLNPTGAVLLRVRGNDVVTWEVRIGFECLNPFNQEMSQNQKLCPSRFERGVKACHGLQHLTGEVPCYCDVV